MQIQFPVYMLSSRYKQYFSKWATIHSKLKICQCFGRRMANYLNYPCFLWEQIEFKIGEWYVCQNKHKMNKTKMPPLPSPFFVFLFTFSHFLCTSIPVPPSTPPGCRLASFFSQDPHFDNSQYFSHFIPTILRRLQLIVFFFLNSYRVQTYSFIFIFQFSIF